MSSNLTAFAYNELHRAGLFDKDSDYGGEEGPAVMELVQTFADQNHSGYSAALVIDLLSKVLAYKPILPLTGSDDEWVDISEESGYPLWQNKRCPSVFKSEDGSAHDVNGKVFIEDGSAYTSSDSIIDITFPYMPKIEYVNVVSEDVVQPHSNS
jgi:hypothetical protein